MKRQTLMTLLFVMILLHPIATISASGYSSVLSPQAYGNTVISWDIVDAPEYAVGWWGPGFVFLGNWFAEDGDRMTFAVTEIGDADAYLTGELVLGNLTLTTNNTEIGYNLILGLAGLVSWLPGIAIPVGESSVQAENQTAFAAAERVFANWLNGSIDAWYENITIGSVEYECIVWDFIQDDPIYGGPQLTTLAYDLETGVLVRCNSTYTFDFPYIFVLELESVQAPQSLDIGMVVMLAGSLGVIGILAVIVLKRR